MAKLIIPKESFPDINNVTEEYQIRYRIVTDDRNVSSYWSPTYSINPEIYYIPGSIYSPGKLTLSKIGSSDSISASWDSATIRKSIEDDSVANSYINLSITNASFNFSTGLITYNVANNLVVGQTVSVYGCSDFRFNFEEGQVFSRTSGNFTFQPATSTLNGGETSSGGRVIGKSIKIGELESYDLWTRWAENGPSNYSPWVYKERISSTSLSINIPSSYIDTNGSIRTSAKILNIEIYRPGSPIERNNTGNFILYSGTLSF
jgi:hypothetical protein